MTDTPTDTPQSRADGDAERWSDIKGRWDLYRGARERGYAHHGPGNDYFAYEDMTFVLRLLDSRDAALREAREEIENLQADAANADGRAQASDRAFAELCQAAGIERGTENWQPWIASVRERFGRAREDTTNPRKVLAAAAEELRLIRMKDTSVVYNPALHTQIAVALARPQPAAPSPPVAADSGTTAVTEAHILYKTGDPDAPDVIKDRNGEVVLGLCRICGRGGAELSEPCDGGGAKASADPTP